CRKFTKYLSLRVVAVYGGTPISEQIGDLKPGAEIVVCTPGRMIDMLAANSGRVTNLRRCTYVVLDEADRMFDMGFEPQVMRIIDGIRPDRQTVMFSATFPRIMEALARRILDKPIEVQVGGRSVVAKEVEQNVVIIKEDDKFLKLLEVLGKYATAGSAIVFVDKQEHADMLLKELMHASYTVLALHGGIDQNDRDSTISDFKNGKVNVLVATSVAARGLDVKHTIVVVNYDCPNHYEDYVHRCGRTGRAGNKGHAYTFITPEQGRYAQDLIKAHEQSGIPVPTELQKLFDDYKVEQEAMGKKVKSSSGFSGKGFKFDEAEAQQAIEKKRIQKAALGLNDSDDEEVEKTDADIDQEIENMLAPKKKAEKGTATAAATAAAAVAAAAATAAALTAAGPSTPTVTPSASVAAAVAAAAAAAASINASLAAASSASGAGASISTALPVSNAQPERSIAEKMELAKQMASKIALSLTSNYPSATAHTEAILKGDTYSLGDITSAVTAKSIAEQRAERLHAKLNYIPRDSGSGLGGSSSSNVSQRIEQELEINDFPQQARWRVTSKEAIAQISEFSEAGITVRGTYYPQGKEPPAGERKLYLAIEATNEKAVSLARAEIVRLIKEELHKM
ncbi:PREDICTED: probable ATP-dependent RNA helicase DDX46, partial [Rhagoletis zephyria]|uniref:probable ATP-dependent RNA helicase DDX46 n=1 Tax=Rhagoletis zephyria TaxID=28612 RepID=UPI0008113189